MPSAALAATVSPHPASACYQLREPHGGAFAREYFLAGCTGHFFPSFNRWLMTSSAVSTTVAFWRRLEPVLRSAGALRFRFNRRIDKRPCPDDPGRVEVSEGFMSARQAFKLTLILAVGLLAMPARGASARTVARIDQHHWNARELGLVLHEQPELGKSPAA